MNKPKKGDKIGEEYVLCECGETKETKWYPASIVYARCAKCHKVIYPVDPETNQPLINQMINPSEVNGHLSLPQL